jgi:phosphate/sulfate permease
LNIPYAIYNSTYLHNFENPVGVQMDGQLLLVVIVIAVALAFDFLNGFHDSANSIATVVSTRVLSPRAAVLLAAICNYAAAFLLETKVASTILDRNLGNRGKSALADSLSSMQSRILPISCFMQLR